ncbi:MAG TPA: hypothetical protein VG937_02165 [Polyangiaceae bacterium]|nr:hypothetical protein [Polyangiaceae bacterium]
MLRTSWHLLLAAVLLPAACGDDDSGVPATGGRRGTGGLGNGGSTGGVVTRGGADAGGAAGGDSRGGAPEGGNSGAGTDGGASSGAPSRGGAGGGGGAPEGGAGPVGGQGGAGADGGSTEGGSAGNAGAGGSQGTTAEPSCEFKLLQKLEPAVRPSGLLYATSLAVSNDTVLVGTDSGAYAFVPSGGVWQQQDFRFQHYIRRLGEYSAITGDTAALGGETGVLTFTRTGGVWSPQSELLWSDDPALPKTPLRVGFSGNDMLLIGAPFAKIGANDQQGAVYVFLKTGNTWTQQGAPLVASDAEPLKVFGTQMAVSGDTALVDSHPGLTGSPGGTDVFVRNGSSWTQQGPRLLPGGIGAIALDGDSAMITRYDGTFTAVHTFERSAGVWAETGPPLTVPFGDGQDAFGGALALAGDTALIGSASRAVTQFNQGIVEVFVRNSARKWVRVGRPLLDSQGQKNDLFGRIVAISPTVFVVQADTNRVGSGSGSAFVFSRTCTPD